MANQELIDFGLFKLDDKINYFMAFLLDRRKELKELLSITLESKEIDKYNIIQGKIIAYEEILEAFNQIIRILDIREGAENE